MSLHQVKGQSILESLAGRIDYAENPDKTQDEEFISAYQCDPRTAASEFMLSKSIYEQRMGRDPGKVIAYQIRQSFKPGEITPEEANQIGYELAMRFTKGRHAFIVCTHTDKAHIHNHIIFNSTSLDCERKFRDFLRSGRVVRHISDHICLEHGLSIIRFRPFSERAKRPEQLNRSTIRSRIRQDIDAVLVQNPASMDDLLSGLQQRGYEIRRGKHISVKAAFQQRPIRLQTLGDGYTEDDLRARFEPSLQNTTVCDRSQQPGNHRGDFSMLIDIQEKLRQGKGTGYVRWAKRFNLKQMAQVLIYLQENGINDYDELVRRTDNASARYDQLAASIKSAETRLSEITELKKHIFNYTRTKDIYAAYRKSGYSREYYEAHRDELALHKAAKDTFNQLNGNIPRIKDLNAEYSDVLDQKKHDYVEYRSARDDMKRLVMARKNVEILLEMDINLGKERDR